MPSERWFRRSENRAKGRGSRTKERRTAVRRARKGARRELARPSAHLTAPIGNDDPVQPGHDLAPAFRPTPRALRSAPDRLRARAGGQRRRPRAPSRRHLPQRRRLLRARRARRGQRSSLQGEGERGRRLPRDARRERDRRQLGALRGVPAEGPGGRREQKERDKKKKTEDEKRDLKTVVLRLDGKAHDLQVGYVAETPVWRPSYRLVVETGRRGGSARRGASCRTSPARTGRT